MTHNAECVVCHRPPDRTLDERGKMTCELRPYGPGGALICFQCATATPEVEREVDARFIALLEANEAISPTGGTLLTTEGPVPLDEETARRIERLIDGLVHD